MIERCRTCWKKVNAIKALHIFSDAHDAVLSQIELVTGVLLPYNRAFPSYICLECQLKLAEAIAFRECCIKTQQTMLQIFTKHQDEQKKVLDKLSKNIQIVEEETDPLVNENNSDKSLDLDLVECQDITQDESEKSYTVEILDDDDEIHENINAETKFLTNDDCQNVQSSAGHKKQAKINWRRKGKKVKKSDVCMCDICGKYFLSKRNLELHQLRHTGIKAFQCEHCTAKFYTTNLLKLHARQHTNPFKCSYCNETFGYNSSKVRHERIHRNEKPFQCHYCEKSFRCSSSRKGHEVTHTRVRKFECKICGLWFLTNKHLNTHRRTKIHEMNTDKFSNNIK